MHFQFIDTETAYRRLLAAPDARARAAIFAAEFEAPFSGMTETMGAGSLAAWVMGPEQLAADRERRLAYLATLAANDAWRCAVQALEVGRAAFNSRLERVRLDTVVFGLFLSDLSSLPFGQGYSGFGGLPGWVMTVYDEPTPANLARVEACTIHELHHNIRFSLFPFNPLTTTVGEYLIAEGLAEAFAAEQYGEELIGPWVSEFDATQLAQACTVVGAALDRTGFDVVRAYIFGDGVAAASGLAPVGVPNFAGYVLGYRIVRAFQQRSGAMAGGRPGFHTVTPYLIHPDVAGLVAYIEQAFGGEETFRSRGSAGGTHVEVRVGDSMLMLGGKEDATPLPAMLFLYVDDVDAHYRQALAAGGTSLMEPAEPGDGDRRAGVVDPFGNQWWIGTHLGSASPA